SSGCGRTRRIMPVKADETYEAKVTGAHATVNEKGTLAIALAYGTSDGPITKPWYVTENTVERLKENLLKCFGITEAQLQDEKFVNEGINEFLAGQTCSIVTEAATDASRNGKADS